MENLPWEDIGRILNTMKSPHKAEFVRYDYRYNPFKRMWYSLQELRDMGVCVDDPMISCADFIETAGLGDLAAMERKINLGTDVNLVDLTGCSAMYVAAVNGHKELLDLLNRAGADVNQRDKNVSSFEGCKLSYFKR